MFSKTTGFERRLAKAPLAIVALGLLAVVGIAYATLCPIGMRPHFADANVERFGAYFALGFILSFAFPRRRLAVFIGVAVLAAGLEAAQLLIPGRDGRLADASVKAAGGLAGASVGYAFYPVRRLIRKLPTALGLQGRPRRVDP